MKGFFSFSWMPTGGLIDLRILTLFKAPGAVAPEEIAAAVEEGAKGPAQPDVILIQYFWYDTEWIRELKKSARVQEIKDRLGTSIVVLLVLCEKNGRHKLTELNKGFADLKEFLVNQIEASVKRGLSTLFAPEIVVSRAPKGFAFRKPSGDHSSYFIHAQNALTDSDHVAFLAYCLLSRVAQRTSESRRSIQTIYIDSMSIASLAFTIKELYQHIEPKANPRIVSFHSHEGMKKTPKPLRGQSLCLISASSSMRLHGDWVEYSKCDKDEVITLITFDDAEKNLNSALFKLPSKNKGIELKAEDMIGEIQIFGENFSASQIHPRRVELFKISRDPEATKFAEIISNKKIVFLDKPQNSGNRKKRSIYIDAGEIAKLDSFNEWLLHELKNWLPPRLIAIIAQDDESSMLFAESVRELLKNNFELGGLEIIKATEVNGKVNPENADRGLLILASQIGKGTSLLSLSRDLRGIHTGPRLYLVGTQIASLKNDIVSLQKNIEFSSVKANIRLRIFRSCAIGPHLESSFEDERKFFKRHKGFTAIPQISQRISTSPAGKDMAFRLLPEKAALGAELILRKDFAFWDKDSYEEGSHNQAAVILTVATMLQRLREDESLNVSLRLSQSVIGPVVLDPINFFRYNDGLIQAALLRCASPAELDYTCEANLSRQVADFLIKIIEHIDDEFGEAALEFLVALGTSRLSIRDSDLARVQVVIKRRAIELKTMPIGKVLKIFSLHFSLSAADQQS
jgi:hypothetical protein